MRKIYSGAPYLEDCEYYTDDVLSFFMHLVNGFLHIQQ